VNLTLKIWRQNGPEDPGAMHEYQVRGISEESSFLEMLDVLNEELFARGEEPIAFDSDCREGICGQCGIVINGIAHGPEVTTKEAWLDIVCRTLMEEIVLSPPLFLLLLID